MDFSRTNTPRTDRGVSTPNSSTSDDSDVLFISDWARKLPAKEGAALTGMTPKGFQKVQLGENTISYKKLTRWLKSDHQFAAAYMAHVGLLDTREIDFAGAFTKAVNAHLQRGA